MGLLDDAIRQHLEFKRLRGADPGEVARQERDALGPVPRDEDMARLDVDQETAELDMRTVLEAESIEPTEHRVPTSTGSSYNLGTLP
jgi:hypothetical protein